MSTYNETEALGQVSSTGRLLDEGNYWPDIYYISGRGAWGLFRELGAKSLTHQVRFFKKLI